MSGNFPTSPGFSAFDIVSNQPVFIDKSESGKRVARKEGGHLWEIVVSFSDMPQSKFAPMDAFIMSQDGEFDSFDITSPIDNQGTWEGASPTVNGLHAAGVETVSMNLTTGLTVKAGDVFRAAGHNKVYKATADAVSVAGVISIDFKPALIAELADTEAVSCTDVQYHVSIKGKHKFNTKAPKLFRFELDLVEAL